MFTHGIKFQKVASVGLGAVFLFGSPLRAADYKINTSSSEITWTGSKRYLETQHIGTLKISSGTLVIDDKTKLPVKASIVADMNTILCTDKEEPGKIDAAGKKKLQEHLSGTDFFDVKSFPTATFELKDFTKDTGVNKYLAKGSLTIKGKTLDVEGIKVDLTAKDKSLGATGNFTFDRTKWGVDYHPESLFKTNPVKKVADTIIRNEISIGFNLMADKA